MALTQAPFAEELRRILSARKMSQRTLAALTGVNQSHLSRLLRGVDAQHRPSVDLVARVAVALGLPVDYFVEYREGVIIERVRNDADFREAIYARIAVE